MREREWEGEREWKQGEGVRVCVRENDSERGREIKNKRERGGERGVWKIVSITSIFCLKI